MCKWVDKCRNVHSSCSSAQECSWAPSQRKQMNEELLADSKQVEESLRIQKRIEKEAAEEVAYGVSDELLDELNGSIEHCGHLVRAHDITPSCILSEFSKRQESGAYILPDDVLNLRILLETTTVDQFLKTI